MSGRANALRLLGIACASLVAVLPSPASAAPEGTKVVAFQLPCDGAVCDPSQDQTLANDATVRDRIQLQASTGSTVGLRTVELQIQVGGDWRCLRRWDTTARTFRAPLDLSTEHGFDGCASTFGGGANGTYRFRTLAEDRAGQTQASAAFLLRVNNAPEAPRWADEPAVSSDGSARPVRLRWFANPEPDVVEYHFVRSGGGTEVEFAVSASRPTGQGCVVDDGVYECQDDTLRSSDAGTYTYRLTAYRESPSSESRCALPGAGACIASMPSPTKSATIQAPPPPASTATPAAPPSAAPASEPGRRGSGRSRPSGPTLSDLSSDPRFCFECGEFEGALPYDSPVVIDTRQLPEDATTPDDQLAAFEPELTSALDDERERRGWIMLSGGLLLLLAAAHLGRALRDPAQTRG